MSLKVSIITPSYNQGKFIEQTIHSVLLQNFANLEYLIIDGGSTDKTIDIIRKHESKIAYWVSEKDDGQSHAVNKGILQSTGDIIGWINSDDFYEQDVLSIVAQIFQDTGKLMITGKCRKFGTGFNEIIVPTDFEKNNRLLIPSYMQPATFVRKSVYEEIGYLNNNLHYCMDYEWFLRFFLFYKHSEVYELEAILSHALMHKESKTVSSYLEFYKEHNAIHYHLAKVLSLDDRLIEKIEKAPRQDDICFQWKINQKCINKIEISSILNSLYPANSNEKSYYYRDAANYLAFIGDKAGSYKAAQKALISNPFLFLNYKYLVKAFLNL